MRRDQGFRHNPETKFYSREKLSKKSRAIVPIAALESSIWSGDLQIAARTKGNNVMKKSLLSALGLAFALAVSMPLLGATSADAAPVHHKHHRHHHRKHHHHHHHHHHKKVEAKKA
ncbi:hypothetical protein LJR234_003988 [Mesorhizobium amorphae]|uniref:hypothetical protein n=1 Tax=Mesorhizobium amorphae TaxID=71433 RepID=UPI003ECFC6D4